MSPNTLPSSGETARTAGSIGRIALIVAFGALWAFGWLPNVWNMIVRGRTSAVLSTEEVPDAPGTSIVIAALYAIIGLACLVVIIGARSRWRDRSWPLLLIALAPSILELAVSNPINGIDFDRPQMLLYALVIITLWLYGPDRALLISIGVFAVASAAIAIVMGVFGVGTLNLATGVVTDKSILFPDLLAGAYSYNNLLGLVVTTALPLVLLVRRRALVIAALLVSVIAIVWTSSRTSLLALAVTAVAAVVLYVVRSARVRAWLAAAALVGVAAVTIIVPILAASEPGSFSARGKIWRAAFDHWSASPWIGLGRDYFSPESPLVGAVGFYISHGHNFFVTVLAVSGIVGVLLTIGVFGLAGWMAVRAVRWSPLPFLFVLTTLVTGVLETPSLFFPFERPNTISFVVWIVIAVGFWGAREASFRTAFALPEWARLGVYREAGPVVGREAGAP